MRYGQADRARPRPLFDHDVDEEILHRTVQIFLDRRIETVDFVDEKHVARLQRGQQPGQVAGFFDRGAARTFEVGAAFVGDDVGQRGLAEPRRTAQQDVVERLLAGLGGVNEQFQLLLDPVLPGEIGEFRRSERGFARRIFLVQGRSDETLCHISRESTCFSVLVVLN